MQPLFLISLLVGWANCPNHRLLWREPDGQMSCSPVVEVWMDAHGRTVAHQSVVPIESRLNWSLNTELANGVYVLKATSRQNQRLQPLRVVLAR